MEHGDPLFTALGVSINTDQDQGSGIQDLAGRLETGLGLDWYVAIGELQRRLSVTDRVEQRGEADMYLAEAHSMPRNRIMNRDTPMPTDSR